MMQANSPPFPEARTTTPNRWTIALAGILLQICLGTVYAWSFFQQPLVIAGQWTQAQVAWAFSLAICFLGLAAAVGGGLLPKTGPRLLAVGGVLLYGLGHVLAGAALQLKSLPVLYVGYGVIGGLGLGVGYVTPVATAAKWFPDRKGFVTGLVVMGFGLGALVMSKLVAPLLMRATNQNLVMVFYGLGAIITVLALPAAGWLRNPPPDYRRREPGAAVAPVPSPIDSPVTTWKCLGTWQFFLMWMVFFCNITAGIMFIGFQSPMLQDLLKRENPTLTSEALAAAGATLIALSSLGNGIGRFLWGGLSDRIGRVRTFRIILGTQVLVFVILLLVHNPWLFGLLVCYVLLCYGGGFGSMPAFVLDVFGSRAMSGVYGAILTAWSMGGLCGPQIVAFIKDRHQSQAPLYTFTAGALVLAIGLGISCFLRTGPLHEPRSGDGSSPPAAGDKLSPLRGFMVPRHSRGAREAPDAMARHPLGVFARRPAGFWPIQNGVMVRFLRALLLGALVAVTGRVSAASRPPNLLLILADDMGFSDAGCYGGEIQTPNLDRLAANGLRFTQFYNTARCWPSRACILTGYYAQSVRRDSLPGIMGGAQGVRPKWACLLPEYLRPLGYRSYHSGKWHVDGPRLAGGFDRSYSIEDHDRYFAPRNHFEDDVKLPPVEPDSGFYTTTFIADHAIKCLREHAAKYPDRPFFHYLAFTCPHFPLHARPEDIAVYRDRYGAGWDVIRQARYERMKALGLVNCALSALAPDTVPSWNLAEDKLQEQIGPGEVGRAIPWNQLTTEQKRFQSVKMAIHAAMIHRLDLEIGRVLDQLKTMGVFENTVVLFLSDNGASAEQIIRGDLHDRSAPPGSAKTYLSLGPGWSSVANTPFRLHKSWVHEGGIATPLIVHWPAGIPARGELRHNPGHLIDLVPTFLELTGASLTPRRDDEMLPPLPGKSLAPALAKDGSVAHDFFWWFHDGNRALRVGDWKLVADHQAPWELYDLKVDRAESRNLAADLPGKVQELEQAWKTHAEEFRVLAIADGQGLQPTNSNALSR